MGSALMDGLGGVGRVGDDVVEVVVGLVREGRGVGGGVVGRTNEHVLGCKSFQ